MQLLSRIPTKLPQGRTEFGNWASSIIFMAQFPDNSSIRFALASMIPQLQPVKRGGLAMPRAKVAKIFFVRALKQGAANQVALTIMQELKQEQQEALKAENAGLRVVDVPKA